MPATAGKLHWKIQAVGTGIIGDTLPIDLGTLTAELGHDGSVVILDDGFADRLNLALAAFGGVMNAER